MDKRFLTGLIILIVGFILSLFLFWVGFPLILVGLIIILNKNEDKIEQIKYQKGGKNGKNKK